MNLKKISLSSNKIKVQALIILSMTITSHVFAKSVEFNQVLKSVLNESEAIKASNYMQESSQESLVASQKHWLPQIYLDVKQFTTNDPANNFVGLLEQRKVEQLDFNPNTLNEPDSHSFIKGSLGLNWMLYEGGMKNEEVNLKKSLQKQTQLEHTKIINEIYLNVFKSFSLIAVSQETQLFYNKQFEYLAKQIKSYQLGQKSNPVGYSGLLGLQGLKKRLEALISQSTTQEFVAKEALKQLGFNEDKNWKPQTDSTLQFVTTAFTQLNLENSSNEEKIYLAQAESASLVANMQSARFKPRIGAFAEETLFNGQRDSGESYTVGLYLQWNLFNAADYNINKEASLKAKAAEKMAIAQKQKDLAEFESLQIAIKSMKENYLLLKQTQQLMDEQILVAENLFKNGSMNTLQFVEVLNRRIDVVMNQNELLNKIIETQILLQQKKSFTLTEY